MNTAARRGPSARLRLAPAALALSLLAACSALPDKPVRPTLYDFGPVPAAEGRPGADAPALVLHDVEASGSLENNGILYRLGYTDANQLRPYALARWSAPPPRLVQQRLRERLGRERIVVDSSDAAGLARSAAARLVLRCALEEFSHYFESTTASRGELRLRCTVLQGTGAGERLLAQRSFAARQEASSADASGGVRALAAATDAVADEIAGWLRQQPAR